MFDHLTRDIVNNAFDGVRKVDDNPVGTIQRTGCTLSAWPIPEDPRNPQFSAEDIQPMVQQVYKRQVYGGPLTWPSANDAIKWRAAITNPTMADVDKVVADAIQVVPSFMHPWINSMTKQFKAAYNRLHRGGHVDDEGTHTP